MHKLTTPKHVHSSDFWKQPIPNPVHFCKRLACCIRGKGWKKQENQRKTRYMTLCNWRLGTKSDLTRNAGWEIDKAQCCIHEYTIITIFIMRCLLVSTNREERIYESPAELTRSAEHCGAANLELKDPGSLYSLPLTTDPCMKQSNWANTAAFISRTSKQTTVWHHQ